MFEKLAAAIVQWAGDVLGGLINLVLGSISMDAKYIEVFTPGFNDLKGVITTLGYIAVLGCLAAESIQLVSAPITGQERRAGINTFVRGAVAGILVPVIAEATQVILSFVTTIYSAISGAGYDGVDYYSTIGDSMQGSDFFGVINTQISTAIYAGIFVIVMLFQIIKAAIALLTRFVTLLLCLYLGPLCVGFFASPSTTNITTSWLKTMLSQIVLIILSAWGFKVIQLSLQDSDALAAVNSGNSSVAVSDALMKFVLVFFICKVLQKLEDLVRAVGFNPLPTGASVRMGFGSVMMMGMAMARNVSHMAGGRGPSAHTGSSAPAQGKTGPSASVMPMDLGKAADAKAGTPSPAGGTRGSGSGTQGTEHTGTGSTFSKIASDLTGEKKQEQGTPTQTPATKTQATQKPVTAGSTPAAPGKAAAGSTKDPAADVPSFGFSMSRRQAKISNTALDNYKNTGTYHASDASQAQFFANEEWKKGNAVSGRTLNQAFEGAQGHDKNWKFDDNKSYAMDQDGHLHGAIQTRDYNGAWKSQDGVTDFSGGKNLEGKTFEGTNSQLFTADTGNYIDMSKDGSIRHYAAQLTGETVSSQSAKDSLGQSMQKGAGTKHSAAMVNQAYANNDAFKKGNVVIPDSAKVTQLSGSELLVEGGQIREFGAMQDKPFVLNTNENIAKTGGRIAMTDEKKTYGEINPDTSYPLGGGGYVRSVKLTDDSVAAETTRQEIYSRADAKRSVTGNQLTEGYQFPYGIRPIEGQYYANNEGVFVGPFEKLNRDGSTEEVYGAFYPNGKNYDDDDRIYNIKGEDAHITDKPYRISHGAKLAVLEPDNKHRP